jgi:acyl carrier protein
MEDNSLKYSLIFSTVFNLADLSLLDKLEYQSIKEWDSVGHMTLISELEEVFGVFMDTEDIIEFSSFTKGKEILLKYGVEF